MYKKNINQIIINSSSIPNQEMLKDYNVTSLGIYSLPGSKIIIDGAEITINQTGLLQIDDLSFKIGIRSLKVPQNTVDLLAAANTQMVIDFISVTQESE